MRRYKSIFCVISKGVFTASVEFPVSFFKTLRVFRRLPCRLQKCNLKGYCFEALAVALGANSSHLEELDLSANDFMDAGLQQLCVGLTSHHCVLQTLRFGITLLKHFTFEKCLIVSC